MPKPAVAAASCSVDTAVVVPRIVPAVFFRLMSQIEIQAPLFVPLTGHLMVDAAEAASSAPRVGYGILRSTRGVGKSRSVQLTGVETLLSIDWTSGRREPARLLSRYVCPGPPSLPLLADCRLRRLPLAEEMELTLCLSRAPGP